jgi:GcrA cell cycle regulator
MRGVAWTAERVALLRKLWAEGETAAAIGARLGGLSRSAVLGKVFRLRLDADGGGRVTQPNKHAARSGKDKPPARRRRPGKRYALPPPQPAKKGKSLLDLTNDSCRWPHGRPGSEKFHFCGAAGADLGRGIPYCARHMRRAYPMLAGVGEEGAPLVSQAERSGRRLRAACGRLVRTAWRSA